MRFTQTLLLALPVLAAAQQKPLQQTVQEWFDIAKSYIPGSIAHPVDAGAARVAAEKVTVLNKDNWRSVLTPSTSASFSDGPDEWMVFFSGGNKTCFGRCEKLEKAWNESAALLAADPTSPHLAYANCDEEPIFCATWAAGPPAIWHIQLPTPQADQSRPASTIHVVPLNTSSTTAADIVKIHTAKTYEKQPVYEGAFHPFDSYLAKFGLNQPLAYAITLFAMLPSWAFMIIISLASRTIIELTAGIGVVASLLSLKRRERQRREDLRPEMQAADWNLYQKCTRKMQ